MNTNVNFQLLNTVLTSPHALALTPGVETHVPTLRFVGQVVRFTTDVNFITHMVGALLPVGYSGNTLDEVPGMIDSAIKKGFADKEGKKGKRPHDEGPEVENPLQLIGADALPLFHNEQREAFVTLPLRNSGERAFAVDSEVAKGWARVRYYYAKRRTISESALTALINTLRAKACFEYPQAPVHLRLGGDRSCVFIDCGDDTGEFVKITAEGWSLAPNSPLNFIQPPGLGVLPRPERGGDLLALKALLGLDDTTWPLLLAFLLNCLMPNGPYMFLLVEGEQGSGKTFLCTVIKRLLDPNGIEKLRLPKTEHDLMIQAAENALLVFDNASTMRWDMSDALCTLATGSGFNTRRYYTDNESRTFKSCRPVIINGIGEFANRPDLLERSIPLRLQTMATATRKTERELWAELERIRPRILGALYDAVACALRRLPETTPPTDVRMADAAHWLVAAEPATGLPAGTFLRALVEGQTDMMFERIVHDPLVIAIKKLLHRRVGDKVLQGTYEGTIGELHERLAEHRDAFDRHFPPTPSHLSTALQRLRPGMAKVGMRVEFGAKTRRGRMLHVWLEDGEEHLDPASVRPAF